MNIAGQEGISEGFHLAQSERAVPGGAGAKGSAIPLPLGVVDSVGRGMRVCAGEIRLPCRSDAQQLEWPLR